MIIEYAPEGGEVEHFDAGRLRTSEVQIIERTADQSWAEVHLGLRSGDVTAMRTVAFVIKKRSEPALRLGGFDPFTDELRVCLDAQEVRDAAVAVAAEYSDDPEQLAEAWEELRDVALDKDACEVAIKDAEAPKDPAPATTLVAGVLPPEPTPAASPTAA
ncbi:hypothetical protein OHB04_22845 [Streptomyces sp. NBC_01775]|uniref:hypothetical protein n=1 Tax=Streptomyces sp. NBC_01775 TaxID=2975939 RepID=UPI002DD84B18|nr:hypothetical protein [Streptomyces sp. NBC_01775]WSB78333.1 hypothetical protein OHB04_22845 [Streptomyces sp. NBC_01775]